MSQAKNIKRWIERINGSSTTESVIAETLLKIRPYSKRRSGISDIEQNGGVECLLKLIQRPNRRLLDISISILANCLTEDSVCKKVYDDKGIQHIVKILQTIKCDSILTRAFRSIANLANDEKCAKLILSIGTAELIINLAKQSTASPEYINSALRAIKNLANSPGRRKKLIQHGAVSVITKCLSSDTKDIVTLSLRALVPLSQACSIEFADCMLGNDGASIGTLVKIIESEKDVDKSSKVNAMLVLTNLTLQGCARPTIGSFGGIRCIVNEVKNTISDLMELTAIGPDLNLQGPLPENSFRFVGALCYYCREAINRAKLRELDVLTMFVYLLWDNRWRDIHPFILYNVLFFEYYEEGLKTLHESGIFPVLLHKLVEYTILEKKNLQAEVDNTVKEIWNGHNLDDSEKFDKRHSLSYDVPTKFNQRPQPQEQQTDTDSTFKLWEEIGLNWKTQETAPYSPQWSPLAPSPVADDFASEATPPASPNIVRSISPTITQIVERNEEPGGEDNLTELLDQDESSSSRDGFDSMHSPALLPATGLVNLFADTPTSSKRSRVSSSESESNGDDMDFTARMGQDLHYVPKKAKIEEIKDTSDRIRSRSLDTGTDNTKSSVQGPNSPPKEFVLPDMGNSACSPNFLRFVNETCSASQILKNVGRDGSSTSGSSTSASAWKQTRRRTSGATKKLDDSDSDNAKQTSGQVAQSSEKSECVDLESWPAHLPKSNSNPLPITKELSTTSSSAKDPSTLTREIKTPVQMILYFLCHYCELSDGYAVSLAQQDTCTPSLVGYLREYPKSVDPRFYRIVDRLTVCPESFTKIVTTFFMPSILATTSLRTHETLLDFGPDLKDLCQHCSFERSTDCLPLVENMIHNISLSHSSKYGSNMIKRFLMKGSKPEVVAACCTVTLLFLWYWKTNEEKSISDSLQKCILSNTRIILDNDKLKNLLEVIGEEDETSDVFQSVSYVLFKLANNSYMELDYVTDRTNKKPSTMASKDSHHECICEYDRHCEMTRTDRTLIFTSTSIVGMEEKLRTSKARTRSQKKSKIQEYRLPVHSDILCEKSPMFTAMLTGKYRESSEERVAIKDVAHDTALYIIHSMYGCKNCEKMDELSDKFQQSSRYKEFCKVFSSSALDYPLELDILRVMDLWLLHDMRDVFYDTHKELIIQNFVMEEIKLLSEESNEGGRDIAQASSTNLLSDFAQNPPFWEFVTIHRFFKIIQDYVNVFCSSCLFQHSHIRFGKVLCRINACSGKDSLFCHFLDKLKSTLQDDLVLIKGVLRRE